MRFGEQFFRDKSAFAKLARYYYGYSFVGSFIRFHHFKKNIEGLQFQSALDAGCGFGEYAFYLAEKNPKARIDAFDIDKKQLANSAAIAKERGCANLDFFHADLNSFEPKKQYDFVFSIDALEHVKNNTLAVKKLCQQTKKGSYFFVHLPAGARWKTFLPKKIFKEFARFENEQHIGNAYSLSEFIGLVESQGMKAIKKGFTFGFFGEIAWELDRLCQEKRLHYLRALFLPLFKAIALLDIMVCNKNGNAFFVLAQKVK